MAYRYEKETGDIVVDGFEKGIASSPHKGLANIQNANISTEFGEVMASFNRTAQITSASTASVSGTLTASVGDGTQTLASNVALNAGQWINVSAATVQVTKTTETVNILAVGGGGGSGGISTATRGASGGGGAGQFNTNGSLSVSVTSYTVTIGAGGTAGDTTGSNGGNGGSTTVTHVVGATNTSDITAIGGGGGGGAPTANANGSNGASGGGGGDTNNATGGTGGTGTAGNNGGAAFSGAGGTAAGGGGGSGGVGADGNGTTGVGGAGGSGTSSSISGGAVTYAAGGTGGSSSAGNVTGTAGTANTGNGASGSSRSTSGTIAGAAGGSGIVIISYPTGNLTASGGTITTSGGNTIHTFTSSGTFTITAINTTQNLATGNYFIDSSASNGTKVKIATSYDPSGASPVTHGTSGTITFTTTAQLGKPISKATETYGIGTATLHRYYILDNNGRVWVNDSGNSLNWVLISPDVSYFGSQTAPSGIAVLNGFLLVFAGSAIYGKPTVNLGAAFTDLGNDSTTNTIFNGAAPHFAYVGHQGHCYYTDGRYIGSIFPDSTIQTGTTANVQSYCSYTNAVGDTLHGTVSTIISGSAPQLPIGTSVRIPAVFFTDAFGTLPNGITSGAVYWITSYTPVTGKFQVLGASSTSTTTLTGGPSSGDTSATLSAAWTGQTFIQPVVFSNGDIRPTQFTNGSTAITWASGLSGGATATITLGSGFVDLYTGAAGNQYFDTFYPIGSNGSSGGLVPTVSIANQAMNLPAFETAQCMTEIGSNIIIGCKSNVLYPWNQVDATPSGIISLPESDTAALLTVNQMAYAFTGHKANVYITDGSVASNVIKVPDYVAGVPGSPATYIEPYYTWADAMYLRGRVYFSLLDQTSTKAGNCGGVWSFVPTQNLYIGQDTGLALRLQNQNSYGTYNGYATILIPREAQSTGNALYWSGWWADTSGTSYGIDYSNSGTSASFTTIIETDAIETGTMLEKKTFRQFEYKLGAPADGTVAMNYRQNLTDAWAAVGTQETDSSGLSGYFKANFEKGQWLQLQIILTPATSTASTNTFMRLNEVRIR